MDKRQLLAIMAAIIFAGADDNEGSPGYTPDQAVERAAQILEYVNDSLREKVKSRAEVGDGGEL
jgi:hypothetical protein